MQLRYVESFLKLFDMKNISKASEELFISQQGLSRQIKTLEKDLGVVLFERTSNGVTPTEIGKKLHPHFKKMYKNYRIINGIVHNNNSGSEKDIIIAIAYGISIGLNSEIFMKLQKGTPDIGVHIKEFTRTTCIDKMQKNEIDIALLTKPFNKELFDTEILTEGYMYAAIHKDHPYFKRDLIDFSELDGQRIITGSMENNLMELFTYYCELTGIEPNIVFSSSNSLEIINSKSCEPCLATVTPIMAEKITNENFKVVRLLTPEPGFLYCCTSKTGHKSPELKKVVDYIRNYFKNIPLIEIKQQL